ncbi:MAG TPA: phosphopantetheine-binding protein [Nitrospinota bacterium]|nr:phosphopantetheine-binding protein [Nitrospinota bacterium]|tara:strand:- start:297009 stop:297275 length:267 start_codon:yes stop_codon:yes gene_type:complete
MDEQNSLEKDLAIMIVDSLNLKLNPENIDPIAPLFGEGLGLDSMDALEISILVSEQYGVKITTDNTDVTKIFSNLRSLGGYIEEHRDG